MGTKHRHAYHDALPEAASSMAHMRVKCKPATRPNSGIIRGDTVGLCVMSPSPMMAVSVAHTGVAGGIGLMPSMP
jgi:hypothetical protein